MYEFWYDYMKLKYGEKSKLSYMDTEDVEARFHASSYELGRSLPKRKSKKIIEIMTDEISGKKMK